MKKIILAAAIALTLPLAAHAAGSGRGPASPPHIYLPGGVGSDGGMQNPQAPDPTGTTVNPLLGNGASGGETGMQSATINQVNDLQSQITGSENTQTAINTAQAATNNQITANLGNVSSQVSANTGNIAENSNQIASNEAAQDKVNTTQQTENGTLQSGINTNASNINNVSTNLGNFEGSQTATNTGFSNDINGINRQITGINGQLNSLNGQIGKVEREANAGVAAALAIPSIPMLEAGKEWIGASYGEYAGQSALGVGYAYQVNKHWNIGAGAAVPVSGNGSVAFKVQAGYEF